MISAVYRRLAAALQTFRIHSPRFFSSSSAAVSHAARSSSLTRIVTGFDRVHDIATDPKLREMLAGKMIVWVALQLTKQRPS